MVNTINLYELIQIEDDEILCEKYVRYLLNWEEEKQYRHDEIKCISKLLHILRIDEKYVNNFIYGYTIPQLNKEMDLLKITEENVLNIELKSEKVADEKIKKQLIQNRHFLKMLNKNIIQICFIKETKQLFFLNNGYDLEIIEINDLVKYLRICEKSIECDLDIVFEPSNILVSPLNSPEKFLCNQYILTEDQEKKKKEIMSIIKFKTNDIFIGLTGNAGTGKTLLLYDIAKELAKNGKVIIVHSGILCLGHKTINENINNIKIVEARDLKWSEIINNLEFDYLLIDEAQRIYEYTFDSLVEKITKNGLTCIFSFDAKQKLSKSENNYETLSKIQSLCEKTMFHLTNKIRTNKEIALFITYLMDLTKANEKKYFPHVHIKFEKNDYKAVQLAKQLELNEKYKFISYTPSQYNKRLDYQKTEDSAHKVIGQEFDKVCMIITDDFFYRNGKLECYEHPNPNYIFTQLLYQGLTRVRNELTLIITSKTVLDEVLKIFK